MNKFWILGWLCFFWLPALHASERVIVQFNQLAAQFSLQSDAMTLVSEQKKQYGIAVYRFSDSIREQDILRLIYQLRQNPAVNWVERDQAIIGPQFIPNDAQIDHQLPWQELIQLDQAWSQGVSCANVVVAVIDSGVDIDHPDLKQNIWINEAENEGSLIDMDGNGYVGDRYGWNAISHNGSVNDLFGHGTHVAGLIAAVGNNQIGVAGSCWDAKLLPVKFLDRFGNGAISNAVEAIYYVIDLKNQFPSYRFIINNSWAAGESQALAAAVAAATDAGIFVVNAAGNSGTDINSQRVFPAETARKNFASLTIANADTNERITEEVVLHSRSNYGDQVVGLAAPGTEILSTWPTSALTEADQWYQFQDGTSMATPIVSGIAAMLWSANPELSPKDLRANLQATIDRVAGFEGKVKAPGLVNANRALMQVYQPFVALSHIEIGTDVYAIKGHKLDLVEGFLLNQQALDIERVDSEQVNLKQLGQLRCGWLTTESAYNSAQIYLDWLPASPVIETLSRSSNGTYVLSWLADESIDYVEVQIIQPDGLSTVETYPNHTQTATITLVDNEMVRLRGISHCTGRQGEQVERFSDFSETKSLTDILAPTWQTVALGQVIVGEAFEFVLRANDADEFSLLSHSCVDDDLVLTVDGRLQGTKWSEQPCELSVVAYSKLSQMSRVQNIELGAISDSEAWRVFSVKEGGPSVANSLLFKTNSDLNLQLLKSDQGYALYWQTREALFELEMRTKNSFRLTDLSWSGSEGEINGLVNQGEYASLIVNAQGASSYEVQDYELSLSLVGPSTEQASGAQDTRCFIASQVYGDYKAHEVQVLREIRDTVLSQWPELKPVVSFYYQQSPGLVEWVKQHPKVSKPIIVTIKLWLDTLIWGAALFGVEEYKPA